MDTRSTSASSKKKRKKTGHSNSSQAAGSILASKLIEEFSCPVTLDIFFEPVMISTCGHIVEGKSTQGLRKCPLCRAGNNSTVVCAAPPQVTNVLSQTLAADPTLWQQVYLDHDYLAEVLRKEELNTPTGERFINLLENNTEDNLNDKAVDGKQAGKSAIEILASHYAGRELLRSNDKIQALISAETKELKVGDKTIDEWLAIEKEEKPVKKEKNRVRRHQPSQNGLFAANQPARQVENNVWQRTVDGKENEAQALLEANPNLIFEKHNIVEHTGREIDDASPFQIALRCGDVEMAEMIKRIALDKFEDGQARLDAQYEEVFPNDYEAHVTHQSDSTFNFNNIVNAISNSGPEDLTAALAKQNNRSALCNALDQFRTDFDNKSLAETVFNPNHLLKAMGIYNAKFDSWNWNQRDLFWRQVIGFAQRYLPSCFKQAFCQGLYNHLTEKNPKDPLTRQVALENWLTDRTIRFDDLDADSNSRLGFDFGVYSYREAGGDGGGQEAEDGWGIPESVEVERCLIQNLCQTKTASLGKLCSSNRIAIRPGV